MFDFFNYKTTNTNTHTFRLVSVSASVLFASTQVRMAPLKLILDPMASQTRSQVTLPDTPITVLSGNSQKKHPKTTPSALSLAIIPVPPPPSEVLLVETVSAGNPELSVLVSTTTTTTTTTGNDIKPPPSVSTGTTTPSITAPTFASTSATRTTKDSAENEDDNKNDPDDMNDNKENNRKKTPTAAPQSKEYFSTLFCTFVFDTDPTCPLLAECLNDVYDHSFELAVLFYSNGSLPNDPSLVL